MFRRPLWKRLPVLRRKPKGRVLAIKWGLNPNSSSLGVDVTFLLFGASALAMATPIISALIRWRRPVQASGIAEPTGTDDASQSDS